MAESTTVNVRPPVWALIVAVALGGGFYLAGKHIETDAVRHPPLVISVSGEGKVTGTPDIALLSFGVQTDRLPTADGATKDLGTRMQKVIASLKQQGIAEGDISTQSLSLYPVYDYSDGRTIPRGYQAGQSLSVKVRDTAKVGDVLSLAAASGANQIGGVSFTIDDPEALRDSARSEAIAQAKEKAQELAGQLGGTLGRMTGFSENSGGYYPPVMYARDAMAGAVANEAKMEVPSGDQEVTVNVSLTYELR
jgi:uncharacterized protein YggE